MLTCCKDGSEGNGPFPAQSASPCVGIDICFTRVKANLFVHSSVEGCDEEVGAVASRKTMGDAVMLRYKRGITAAARVLDASSRLCSDDSSTKCTQSRSKSMFVAKDEAGESRIVFVVSKGR